MMYILIIIVFSGTGGGIAATTAEFNGEENCLAAAYQVNSMSKSFRAICAKRGR